MSIMPLLITQYQNDPICRLSTWTVADGDSFVDVLAWLYLRKPSHAVRIINDLEPGPASFPGREFENAIKLLTYDISDISAELANSDPAVSAEARKIRDARIVLRDGLLFQHVSWVAANMQFPGAKACPPHVRKADKGFDGLLIELDALNSGLSRLILCEDKASTNPRSLVTGKIWPEVVLIANGDKDLEILDAVTAILDTVHGVERENALLNVIWSRIRQFRVAVTAGPDQIKAGGYAHLFAGFDNHAIGAVETRMAEVMPMQDVRAYLQDLASRITNKIQTMAANV